MLCNWQGARPRFLAASYQLVLCIGWWTMDDVDALEIDEEELLYLQTSKRVRSASADSGTSPRAARPPTLIPAGWPALQKGNNHRTMRPVKPAAEAPHLVSLPSPYPAAQHRAAGSLSSQLLSPSRQATSAGKMLQSPHAGSPQAVLLVRARHERTFPTFDGPQSVVSSMSPGPPSQAVTVGPNQLASMHQGKPYPSNERT